MVFHLLEIMLLNNTNNNNNNKTCNAHVSNLLGVQGAVKPTTNKTKQNNKQNKEKQTQFLMWYDDRRTMLLMCG